MKLYTNSLSAILVDMRVAAGGEIKSNGEVEEMTRRLNLDELLLSGGL